MPDIICNLYRTTTAIANGMKISNLKDILILKRGKTSLRFSHKFTSAKGFVSAFKFRPSNDLIPDYGLINIMDFHKQLGHPNQQSTKETAEKMQVTLEGRWETCEACSLAKSKQKNMNQVNEHRSIIPGERLYTDISYINGESLGGKVYWDLVVDEATGMKFSGFIKKKSDFGPYLVETIRKITNKYHPVKYIRCDRAGENEMVEKYIISQDLKNIQMEFTSSGTPQQNGIVERAFATLYNKVRAMLNEAGCGMGLRKHLWAECANTAVKLENIIIKKDNESSYFQFTKKSPKYQSDCRKFGEMAVIKNHSNSIQHKLKNKGFLGMFVGYPTDSAEVMYHFLKFDSQKIHKEVIVRRDVTWWNILYGEFLKLQFKKEQ